jgi:hypothetical protein
MGVQQAIPVINMAKEMRESEGQAAKVIAGELAEATLEGNRDILSAIKSQAVTQSPNPMAAMFTQTMQPYLGQMIGNLMGTFQPKPGQPQPGTQPQPGQPSTPKSPGAKQINKEKFEEAFNG